MKQVVVKKFGGTSLANLDRILEVAQIIAKAYQKGEKPIIIASAMSGQTQKLEDLLRSISFEANEASDMVLSSGEQISVGLLSLMIDKVVGKPGLAKPLLADQIPLLTKSKTFGGADIEWIDKNKIEKIINDGHIPVLPGFQCFDGEYTKTMGRGGSDTSAVSIAGLLGLEKCEIYTDVNGVYSTDPRIYSDAKKFFQITTEEMRNLSNNGAKVMHPKAVKAIDDYLVKVEVRSTMEPETPGTLILSEKLCKKKLESKDRIEGITCFENLVALKRKNNNKQDIYQSIGRTYSVEGGNYLTMIQDKDYERLKKEDSIKIEDSVDTISNCGQVSLLGRDWLEDSKIIHNLKEYFSKNDFGLKEIFPINHGISFLVDSHKAKPLACSLHKKFNNQIRSVLEH